MALGGWLREPFVFGVVVVAWPERIVLGVIGRRADELALAWAFGLARRWSAELHVVAGYHPPVGMFPHIVTAHELQEARDRARSQLTATVREALVGVDRDAIGEIGLTLVTDNQLDHAIATRAQTSGLTLFSVVPPGLFARRHLARARRVAAGLPCPSSLGPGRAVEPAGLDLVH